MLRTALFTLAFAGASASYPEYPKTNPFSYGHGVFTYGPLHCTPRACDVVPSCHRAHWATNIEAPCATTHPAPSAWRRSAVSAGL